MTHIHQDILLQIFCAVALNEPPRFIHVAHLYHPGIREFLGLPVTLSERLGWIRLGHVDHIWRVTLLSAQALWADHIGSLPAGVDQMLTRAGPTAPLTLYLPLGVTIFPSVNDLAQFLSDHGDAIRTRLRCVVIWDPCPVIGRHVPRDSQLRAECSALSVPWATVWNDESNRLFPFSTLESILLVNELPTLETLDLSRPSISQDRLIANAPFLRHLRLQNCLISCPRSTQLVTISLSRTVQSHHHNNSAALTVDEILDFVKPSAASLQYLELDNILVDPGLLFGGRDVDPPVVEEPVRRRVVDLPRLRKVSLRETQNGLCLLLASLQYPQSAMTCLGILSYGFIETNNSADRSLRAAIAKYPDCHAVGLYFHDEISTPGNIDLYARPVDIESRMHTCAWYRMHLPIIRISTDTMSMSFRNPHSSILKAIANELAISGIDAQALTFNLKRSKSQDKILEILNCAPLARNICIETQSTAFMAIAYALRQHIADRSYLSRTICLVARVEPTAIANLAMMSIVFGQARPSKTVLHIDKEFERMPGGEKMRGYVMEFEGAFKEVTFHDCKI